VVDAIAAGEVVERPASAVKELVENALDAGARRVEVDIEGGGRTRIRVADDGEGMGPEDLALAFSAHATSKIRGLGDLDGVATYGFRGEALASLGAVSDASITSRARGSRSAHRVEARRGERGPVRPAAGPEGTTVEVAALFAGVPARRKFLRAPATESAKVVEAVSRIALARPDVGFLLRSEGRVLLDAPAGEAPRDRAARALGADLAATVLPVVWGGAGGVRVEGFVGAPAAARAGRAPQFLSVNGRPVSDRSVTHAVREGMEGLLLSGRQPAWALAVSLPPGDVDVNVHPAKAEVRFLRTAEVHEAVRLAVRESVLAAERAPPALGAGVPAEARDRIRDALESYLGGAVPAPGVRLPFAGTGGGLPAAAGGDGAPGAAPGLPAADWDEADEGGGGAVLQVRNSFLVFEVPDGIAIVDQHALHERVLLEGLRRATAEGAQVQRLLLPEVLEVGPADVARVAAAAPDLRRAGLLLEPFGPGAVAVHGVPLPLSGRPVRAAAEAALEILREDGGRPDREALLHGVLERMACRAAVKAGDPLNPSATRTLLDQARGLPAAGHCAHGRPTELRIRFDELERRFRRT